MGLTTRTIPAIHNGVSKQPAILRSADQTEDELNTWGYIASGVGRRPPTELVAELNVPGLDTAFVHHINRDVSERYIVVVSSGSIRVFDSATGVEKTVSAPGGYGYLSSSGAAYRAVTVADYTFIVNTDVVVALGAVGDDQAAQPVYLLNPGGTSQTIIGPDGTPIPAGYAGQYAANPSGGVMTGEVQKFEDLPSGATTGAIYHVSGATDNRFVGYYVQKNADGTWNECVAPGLRNSIDQTTMPHALVRQADGTFTFAPFSWRPRRVGDASSNPPPPFVGRAIRDVFFYQNRLGFLVDESAVFSAAGDYGDFWRRTVLDYIDSDVVSVAATTTDVAVLDYAVPFSDGVMLFSRQRQFALSNGEAGLTPASVAITPVTRFVMSAGVRPAPLGNLVYFASDVSGYTAVQEYTRLDGSNSTDAAEVTSHVPGLIPVGASDLISAPDANAVFVLVADSSTKSRAFAYQFFWDKDTKLQSAWRPWDFGSGQPLSGTYVDGGVYLVMKRGTKFYLEKLNLSPGAVSAGQGHLLYVDRQVQLTGVYDAGTDRTTFTFPYDPDPDLVRLLRGGAHANPESLIDPSTYTVATNTVSVPGDESAHPVTAGEVFTSYLRFSQQFPLDYLGRPLSTGRLQLHTFTVVYDKTGFFDAEVAPYGTDGVNFPTATVAFTGRILGSAGFILGQPAYHTGKFTFSVAGEASVAKITLSNSTPYASTWVSAEWEGLYFGRAAAGR